MTPAEVRRLRGDQTRAAFAAELGVNAHSVYRWEQPGDSPHARRPRGAPLARLRALADANRAATARDSERAPHAAVASLAATDADALAMSTALQRMLDGEWSDAENVFLRALGNRNASAAAHVLAATGLAAIELLFRADGRRALAAIGPAFAPGAPPFALAEAVLALAYSFPDGELFDLGRVHAHAARAEALAGSEAPVASALALAAQANAAVLSGDDDLLLRALSRVDDMTVAAMPEVPAMFVEQLRALAAARSGQQRVANERLDRLLANPRLASAPPLEARVCAMRALRSLDELGDPTAALALARRARTICESARLAVGVHTGIMLRAEAEALLRLGRLPEAGAVFVEADRIFAVHRFPPTIVLPAQARYLLLVGHADELQALSERIAAVELPSIRAVCQAYAAWIAATAALSRGDDAHTTTAAFTLAERLCERWSTMHRDLLVSYAWATTGAALANGDLGEAHAVLARARRAADRVPTAWTSAHLRRAEATLLVAEGRIAEGRTVFEAAAATFEASGDRLDAAIARYGAASILDVLGIADAVPQLAAAEAELRGLGLAAPIWIMRTIVAMRGVVERGGWPRVEPAPPGIAQTSADARVLASTLEVALQRLAVSGASTDMVLRELATVARELAGAPVVIEDEGPDGARRERTDVIAWFDIAGGPRRMRLGVTAPPNDSERTALRVLAVVAGLALEAAALRAGGSTAAPLPFEVPEVPGLVAASPAMRRVLADVGRLAGSRATVVVSGESGVGKELIARALHQVSPRAAKPYVAFNCAAVPHELFEGQLFGYRKGAFTGAVADHLGVVRAADGGTLFLDEIGELPLDIQPKLLRFLDNAEVFPLGAARPITVDVRVIAATNRDLAAEVRRGNFREDLYYRLLVVPLHVPPLRERRDDIVPLARSFARALTTEGRPPAFAPDALAALTAHPWPGNVRELRNVIARALAYSPPPEIITRAQLAL